MLTILVAAFAGVAHADSSDIPQWYGTITFSKTLSQHATETFPKGHAYAPGTEKLDTEVTWSGTARYLPGRKMVVVASYTFTRTRDRRTDRIGPCPWKSENTASHDYELMEERTRVSVNKQWDNNDLSFRIRDDGTYRGSATVSGGNQVSKAQRVRARREFFTECSKPHLTVKDDIVFGSAGMESLTLNHIEGKTKPDAKTLSGNFSREDDDRGKLSYSWSLTRVEPVLVARIEATPVQRGAAVTLNASASTGPIIRYEWEFSPNGDCQMTREGLAVRLTGVSVTFKALCDFTAKLKVSSNTASDSTSLPVPVEARPSDAWTTKFKSWPGDDFSAPIDAVTLPAGINQCSLHRMDVTTGHWIHTENADRKTWREGGYVLAQLQDAGPFKGVWYVQSQSLQVDRQERVNALLLKAIIPPQKDHGVPKAGSIYKMNAEKKNEKDIEAFVTQIRAHERAHSELVQEKLLQLGPDGDPAARIEKLVGGEGEKAFQETVDDPIRGVESALVAATEEANVANRLRADGRFNDPVGIWVPGSVQPSGARGADFKKPLGPLWAIGSD